MSDIFGNPVDNHPAHVSLNPKCVYCQWVRDRIQRDAVDAYVRDELPGLLAEALEEHPGFTWHGKQFGSKLLAAKIAELRTKAR